MYAHIGPRKVKSWYINGMNNFLKFHLLCIYNKNEKEKNTYKIHTFNTFIFERLYDFITYHGAYL